VRCPYCAKIDNSVLDSRLSREGTAIRRRRKCDHCHRRFTTYERIEEVLPVVVKKDGRREPYDRAKVVGGVKRALEKRPVPAEDAEKLVDEVERMLIEKGEREVPTTEIGEEVMRRLRDLDQVAYVRFASVYRSFQDVGEFMDELKALVKHRGK
jgi:transcriptional repressor NrdR